MAKMALIVFFLGLASLTSLSHGVTSIPRIFLFSQTEFTGSSYALSLYPGCNNIWAYGWDKTTASLVRSNQCIILYEKMNCRGHSVKVTVENENDLRNIEKLGFVHSFPSGLSAVAKCESDVCTARGTFIRPGYCDKYFRCTANEETDEFTRKIYRCPDNLQFDPKLGQCTQPEKIIPNISCED